VRQKCCNNLGTLLACIGSVYANSKYKQAQKQKLATTAKYGSIKDCVRGSIDPYDS
jgi:hypothetical protein